MESYRVTLLDNWSHHDKKNGGHFKSGHVFESAPVEIVNAIRAYESATGKSLAVIETKAAPARRPVE